VRRRADGVVVALATFATVATAALGGCGRSREWARAEAMWRDNEPGAWAVWRALPDSDEGRAARARLADADARYRRGIALIRAGQSDAAREELAAGRARGPIDPALYLPLARACRDRELRLRAAEFYRKFLAQAEGAPAGDVAAARAELAALEPEDPIPDEIAAPTTARPLPATALTVAAVVLGALALAAVVVLLAVRARRRRGETLAALAAAEPSLEPAIAFLVGCLRHELLKHRVLAVTDAVRALARGEARPGEREFLVARLYGGDPLPLAWVGHLGAFIRALGPRFDLERTDPGFRAAGRAVAEIAALRSSLVAGERGAATRLARAHERLAAFDRALAELTRRLTQAAIDRALLDEVVAAIDAERRGAGAPEVAITIGALPDGVRVEMYRVDLALVLRNVVRNAVVAAARGPAPRRVAIDVQVALEPTGEEVVRVRVRDTSPEPIALESAARASGRGLHLVTSALARVDGGLEVAPGGDGFAKALVVRLFRALDEPEPDGDAAPIAREASA
jgi:hypothetical protein